MDIKTSNALLNQAKFSAAETIEEAWPEAMKDLIRMHAIDPSKKFSVSLKFDILAGNQTAIMETSARWGVRKEVKGEAVTITLEGDMFGDIK